MGMRSAKRTYAGFWRKAPGSLTNSVLNSAFICDSVLALSNSGSTPELLTLLPLLKRQGNVLISMTGNPESELARASDAHLDSSVATEACPLDLAPTSSTTSAPTR